MDKFIVALTLVAFISVVKPQQEKKDVLFFAIDDLCPELGLFGIDNI